MAENRRMEQMKPRERAAARDEIPESFSGAHRHALGDPALQEERLSGQANDPADLGKLVQRMKVFQSIAPRESAHPGVSGAGDGKTASHAVVRVRRTRPGESEDVIAQRDLVEARRFSERRIRIEAVLEGVDSRARLLGIETLGLFEVV